jgi:eukaryotic-like serine/threonine-protein kinase
VPDVATLSYADAVQKLKSAGFTRFKQTTSTSTPELKDKAIGTNPPANQTSAITNEITVIIGAGPETKPLPDVGGLSVDLATTNLKANGFDPTKITQRPVDSTQPAGEVIGTKPAAGSVVPLDSVVELQVSQGNQFVMPDLTGQFWVDAEPRLRALGWTGVLDRGADVSNSGQRTNAVVTQSPAAGTAVTFGSRITLSFAS